MAKTTNIGPRIACELTPQRIIAARAADTSSAIETSTVRILPDGALAPNLTDSNLKDSASVQQGINDAINVVGGRSRDVVAILPDSAVRVTLLDFESLPEKKSETDAVVRFRLKKAVPFDVDHAAISYDVRKTKTGVRVIAAAALDTVLAEYEEVFRSCGFAPGVVLPSMLACLGNVTSPEPTLVIKIDALTTTFAIVAENDLLLVRTLENTNGTVPSKEQLVEDVFPSLVFFQDTYNMRVESILIGGAMDADEAGESLQSQTGVPVRNLVSATLGSSAIPGSMMAGVVGALAS
jgi:type IV pilus assembly protein PilM